MCSSDLKPVVRFGRRQVSPDENPRQRRFATAKLTAHLLQCPAAPGAWRLADIGARQQLFQQRQARQRLMLARDGRHEIGKSDVEAVHGCGIVAG